MRPLNRKDTGTSAAAPDDVADPDSLSGKARKAAAYGIPIVTEQAFSDLLAGMP